MLDGVHCGTLFQLKVHRIALCYKHLIHHYRANPQNSQARFGEPHGGPPCLAEARSRNGSGVINAIHYRSDASLPAGEGNIKALPLIVYLLFG